MRKGWTYRRIGDVCTVIGGATPKTEVKEFWGGKNYWITPADLDGRKYQGATPRTITDAAVEKTNLQLLPVGTVLLSSRAPIGKVAITTVPMYCNQGFKNIICPDSLLNEFVYWFLFYNKDYLNSLGTGATFKEISKKTTESVMLPVPPLAEQERIVAELDLLQGIINKQKAQLNELDTLAQSIFYDMFGDPVENERRWQSKPLKELSTLIINGTTPKGGAEVYVPDGIVFFRSQNVWRNRIDYDDVAHIDKATDAKMKKSSLHHNDILITKTGRINTENSSLGRAALYEGATGEANINGHVYLIRLKAGIVSHQFVLKILTSVAYRDYIRKVCVGGIDKRQINKEHVEEFPIILPPVSLQQAFATKIEALERQKASINASIAETQKLFDYTMDKYFG